MGDAALSGKNEVTLKDGKKITGKNIIIATGSRPRIIPGFEFDEEQVLSSTGALMLKKLPKKAIILGAGAIGVEFSARVELLRRGGAPGGNDGPDPPP